jgi:hypothetical protein
MSEQKSRRDFIQSSALKTTAGLGLASASLASRSVAGNTAGTAERLPMGSAESAHRGNQLEFVG